MRAAVCAHLQRLSRTQSGLFLSFCSDLWTGVSRVKHMDVNLYWWQERDGAWHYCHVCLCTFQVHGKATATQLGRYLSTVLQCVEDRFQPETASGRGATVSEDVVVAQLRTLPKLELRRGDIVAAVTDGAANIKKAVAEYVRVPWSHCAAHCLNLAVLATIRDAGAADGVSTVGLGALSALRLRPHAVTWSSSSA